MELNPKYKADPTALIIRENKARGEKQPKRMLKANDVKTLCARFRNGVEGDYTDEQVAAIKEHLGQLAVTMGLVV